MITNDLDKKTALLAELVLSKASHTELLPLVTDILFAIRDGRLKVLINWHPLGFLQFKLGKLENETSVKLHIWDDILRLTQEPAWLIHRHEWDLQSHVLYGTVSNHTFNIGTFSDADISCRRHLYKVEFDGQYSKLIKTSEVTHFKLEETHCYSQGNKYEVLSDQYHSTTVEESSLASTLVVSTEKVVSSPFVLGELDGNDMYTYHRSIPDEQTWLSILNKFIRLAEL